MMHPRLVYDDDCGFCTWAASFVARRSECTLIGFSDLSPEQRGQLPANYEECAHLLTDDRVYSCGEAMEEAFSRTDLTFAEIVPLLRRIPGHARTRERIYRWIAENRDHLGTVVSLESPRQSE